MKILIVIIKGNNYKVNHKGEIYGGEHNLNDPSGDWLFLGVSTHHWHGHITHSFNEIWENPSLAIRGYLWDKDHGTVRTWGGSYYGKTPKITACYFE